MPSPRSDEGAEQGEQSSAASVAGCREVSRSREREGGMEPKKMRPMKVAVPVASATGRKVRARNSGIISSMANITPPIGVLKVAAMPAPAPAATSVMRCQGAIRMICPSEEPSEAPIWMIGPSRPTAAPVPIDIAEASALITADDRTDVAILVVDCVHHLGHAVTARFRARNS